MKTKIAVLMFILVFLAGCSAHTAQVFPSGPKRFVAAEQITFGSLLPPETGAISIQNAEYLFEGMAERKDIKIFFSDIGRAKQALYSKLKPLTHFHTRLPCSLSAEPESIFELSLPQLLRVYLIYDALENGNMVSQISRIINEHKEGNYYEPGGVGLLKNGQVVLWQIPSEAFAKKPGIESVYIIPTIEIKKPHIFTFHLHPLGNSGPAPGPSWKVKLDDQAKEAKFDHDIGAALIRADDQGDYHHLLISKMRNNYFNVDYYVAEKIKHPPAKNSPDYCDKLSGFRIVDLGVWRY